MNELDVPIRSIMPAFQGVIPSPVATVSADGTPNITYVSVVRFLDDDRIAFSNQFLGKTADNLRANPSLTLRVVDPEALVDYDLEATWLRSERAGELFDSMRTQIDAIADQTGISSTLRLRAVEVLRVDRCRRVRNAAALAPAGESGLISVDALTVFAQRLDACHELGDLTQTALDLLDDLFGIGSSMLLMGDEGSGGLFVVAHHGSTLGSAAEVPMGEGIIGMAAVRKRQVSVPHVARARTLNQAAAPSAEDDRPEIPLPGLPDAQSLVATPILLHGQLRGLLYVDSTTPGRYDTADSRLLELLSRQIGMSIGLLDITTDERRPVRSRREGVTSGSTPARVVVFHDTDGTVLIDGDYIIRGVAGRLLFAMLREFQRSGRTRFSNRELRLNRDIGLPAGNDNLDARLLALRRRLAERADPFQLERVERGQHELSVHAELQLTEAE